MFTYLHLTANRSRYLMAVRWEWCRNWLWRQWYRWWRGERPLLTSKHRVLSDQHLNHLEDVTQPRLWRVAPVHQQYCIVSTKPYICRVFSLRK